MKTAKEVHLARLLSFGTHGVVFLSEGRLYRTQASVEIDADGQLHVDLVVEPADLETPQTPQ